VLRGPTKITLDAKGRLAIPTRFRELLTARCDGKMVVTVDRQRCLLIYPTPEWEDVERELARLANIEPIARSMQQMMIGYATDVEQDGHGRILLPRELRDFARLERQAMLLGVGKKFELWDEACWNEKRDAWLGLEFDAAARELLKNFNY